MKSTKQFITSLVIKIIIFIVISTALFVILNACAPVITNDIALGQLENDDVSYIAWELYSRLRTIIEIVYYAVTALCIISWGYSVYKFINNKNNI